MSQTPAWLDCACLTGRYEDVTRAYRTSDGRELVLPLARLSHLPDAAGVESSMPFGWGTGGLVASDGRVDLEDVAAVAAELLAQRRLRIAVRPGPTASELWDRAVPLGVTRTHHMSHVLDLAEGFDDIWAHRFNSEVRRRCRRADRLELSIEWDDTGRLIGVFDALYRLSIGRWAANQNEPEWLAQWRGRRRDPRRKFDIVAERLGDACRVWVARRADQPIAAIIVLTHGEHTTIWRGAMDYELASGTGANEALHRRAIEHACASGRRWLHMGESAPGSGLASFKKGFGTVEEFYAGYRFERLPLTEADARARRTVKRALRVRD